MTSSLQTDVSWDGVVATVTATGDLDIAAARALRRRLQEVASACPERLVLDLGGLVLVDAAGAKALDDTQRRLQAGCPVIVRSPPAWSDMDAGRTGSVETRPAAAPGDDLSNRLEKSRARAAASYERTKELLQHTESMLAASRRLRQEVWETCEGLPAGGLARRELLQRSAYARLVARLRTLPVIEQAKGIVMAQSGCGAAEAFDVLRRASQRSNVPVQELAAQLVAKSAGTAVSAAPEPRDPVAR